MPITLTRLDPTGMDHDDLVDFMTRNEFGFHVRPRLTREEVEAAIARGAYRDEDNDSCWVEHTELGRIGFLRFEDLSEGTPLFDLRLDTPLRGRGLAADVLRAATDHVFTTMDTHRFEGQTREDNIAMRKTFLRCGWLKEAHYREAWPVGGGAPVASVAYAILRRDWETGRTTPLLWEDLTL
ncbi:GNAT family N-acetyltransferase [Actinotalea sp. K2]|uniref:GNAT family N-acetyltransferase n=1 Tax=Actinotalea sp. K2 TaxID=2939438 RepID=UPI00201764AD|nr:GNAT family protein [Actinotalea sp. K2]MCL3859439.1 GNAT family N-acetyltransferase [Actinotalea sp. K2]